MILDVLNLKNEKIKEVEVSDVVFKAEVKPHLLHQVVTAQLRNRRQFTAKTKSRGEIAGSTRKIYKQKGTGNARHGSKKAPIFRGGGTVFGPRGLKSKYKTNKKVMKNGLRSALSMLVGEGKLHVVENLKLESNKTKDFVGVLKGFNLSKSLIVGNYDVDKNIYLASRNIQKVKMIKPEGVNVYDLLKYQNIIISEEAIKALELRLA